MKLADTEIQDDLFSKQSGEYRGNAGKVETEALPTQSEEMKLS
jgi:hypothetical protein